MKSLLVFCLLLILSSPGMAVAAGHTVKPLLIDLETEERDIIKRTVTITNPTQRVIRVYASVHEVALEDGGEIKEFLPPSDVDGKNSITSWIELTRARIQLEPGEEREVPVTIRIHPNAESGEYHALLGFGTGANRSEAEAQTKSGNAPATIIRLSLDNERYDFLRLKSFSIDRFVTDSDQGGITYELSNPTKHPIVPGGEIIFYDNRGNEVTSLPVNPNQEPILPGNTVTFSGSVPDTKALGRYKAFLSVEYGENQLAAVHDTAFFYLIPVEQLVIIFLSFGLIAGLLTWWLHRRFYHNVDHEVDHHQLPLFVRTGTDTTDHHTDVNLKQKHEHDS